jgi:hypothetical protein
VQAYLPMFVTELSSHIAVIHIKHWEAIYALQRKKYSVSYLIANNNVELSLSLLPKKKRIPLQAKSFVDICKDEISNHHMT